MRAIFLRLFRQSPFENLHRHAEKVKEAAQVFKDAFQCYLDGDCDRFEELHEKVTMLESEADEIKRNIRGHLPKGIFMPVEKFPFLWYLREQDKVCDAVQDVLHWLSFRTTLIPEEIAKELRDMVDNAVEIIQDLLPLVEESQRYFRSFSENDRQTLKDRIGHIRRLEYESDTIEKSVTRNIFIHIDDPMSSFHLIRLVEILGEISNHAENAADMMRTMIAR